MLNNIKMWRIGLSFKESFAVSCISSELDRMLAFEQHKKLNYCL